MLLKYRVLGFISCYKFSNNIKSNTNYNNNSVSIKNSLLFSSHQIIEHKFIVMEEVNTVHSLIPDSDVIKDQPVNQPLLHPPQQVGLVIHHSRGGHANILEIFSSQNHFN